MILVAAHAQSTIQEITAQAGSGGDVVALVGLDPQLFAPAVMSLETLPGIRVRIGEAWQTVIGASALALAWVMCVAFWPKRRMAPAEVTEIRR
ncbi:MAG TPA: hypothetical protein H9830_10290 [Candidatus Agrococcus pullicola]|uniref:Uncharacterized protein n=1 Tax=Candidatus Agrococcus pullicola TaxID=2838429 RepID=A0A9D1YWN5_9MICO|nr:hypothetical protein [Candidatus Agrococcus pullicola]